MMEGRSRILAIPLVLGLLIPSPTPALGQDKVRAETETAWGLHTATFATPRGKIRMHLPDDLSAGDTISGTVIAEPAGKTEAERATNQDELNGYVVEIEKQKTSAMDKWGKWIIPAIPVGATAIPLILRDKDGREVTRTNVPVQPAPPTRAPTPPTSGDFQLPRIGQAGRPVAIQGPFDGEFPTTGIKIGGQEVPVLAESPRKLVARSPRHIVGPTEIEVKEGNAVARGRLNNLGVTLTAPKTTLLKGERTMVTARVEGLQGLSREIYPIPFEMANRTPEIITFEGGRQTISHSISFDEVSPEGTWTFPTSVLATQAGEFNIAAMVRKQDIQECKCIDILGRSEFSVKNIGYGKEEIWFELEGKLFLVLLIAGKDATLDVEVTSETKCSAKVTTKGKAAFWVDCIAPSKQQQDKDGKARRNEKCNCPEIREVKDLVITLETTIPRQPRGNDLIRVFLLRVAK
jgi:hypothetical protein